MTLRRTTVALVPGAAIGTAWASVQVDGEEVAAVRVVRPVAAEAERADVERWVGLVVEAETEELRMRHSYTPGQPRLRPGEDTLRLHVRISAPDRELARRAAEQAGESLSEYVRGALVHRAIDDLGLSVEAYLDDGVERRDPAGRRCWRCGRVGG